MILLLYILPGIIVPLWKTASHVKATKPCSEEVLKGVLHSVFLVVLL